MKMFDQVDRQVLESLRTHGSQTLEQLASTLKVNKSTLFYRVTELLEQEFIEKKSSSKKDVQYSLPSLEKRTRLLAEAERNLTELLLGKKNALPKKQKPKLVFSDSYIPSEKYLQQLKEHFEIQAFPESTPFFHGDTFVYRCKDADVIVTFGACQVTRQLLLQLPNLKVIVSATITNEFIDVQACQDLGIHLYTLPAEPSYKRPSRREFIFAALFALLRPLHTAHSDLKIGNFDYSAYPAQEVYGKKIGLVGTDKEVGWVASIFRSFGAEVLIANVNKSSVAASDFGLSHYTPLAQLFQEADVMIFPEHYTPSLSLNEFLKKDIYTKYFLFLTRTIDFDVKLLRQQILKKQVLGVVLDYYPDLFNIFDSFATSEYRHIYNLPQVIVTPEVGFYTQEAMQRNYSQLTSILLSLVEPEKER